MLLPLSRPALATVAILALVGSWNSFLLPLLILGGTEQWTLPLGVMNFSTQYSQDVAAVLAYTALSMVPALLFYVFAERQLIGGLTTGSGQGMTPPPGRDSMTLVDRTTAPVEPDPPYRDPSLPVEERVEDLLARMTLEEKLAQLGSFWAFEVLTDGAPGPGQGGPR